MSSIIYYCANRRCAKEISPSDLESLPGVKCPHCGGRILFKARPKVIKKVKSI
ncbi:MAG: DNA-directed RNA polymerase subunit P [Candidatus Lokiarchaeota archaeon]|nr:DNA-directed RNA polymerase subunit P [Candidatus Lokiarchaeota archaeon]